MTRLQRHRKRWRFFLPWRCACPASAGRCRRVEMPARPYGAQHWLVAGHADALSIVRAAIFAGPALRRLTSERMHGGYFPLARVARHHHAESYWRRCRGSEDSGMHVCLDPARTAASARRHAQMFSGLTSGADGWASDERRRHRCGAGARIHRCRRGGRIAVGPHSLRAVCKRSGLRRRFLHGVIRGHPAIGRNTAAGGAAARRGQPAAARMSR